MRRSHYFAVGVLWLLAACSVASVEEQKSGIAQNQCTNDSQCPDGICTGSQCRTSNGTFDTMLFSVTPPADMSGIAGVQFLTVKTGVSKAGGQLDLPLELVAQVTGKVTLASRDCVPKFQINGMLSATAADSSVPAVVSFRPSAGALGLFVAPSAATATLVGSTSFQFRVNVPPGQYEIYVQPADQPDGSCVVPPQLLRAQTIQSGTHPLNIPLPQPSTFNLHVDWPLADGGLDGWTVDMLDPISGLVISNRAQLTLEKTKKSYLASLSYLPVLGDTSTLKAQELVRLSPPDGQTAPSILLSRGALSLFSTNSGTLSQFTSLPSPVHVAGQVTALSTPTPVAATITVVATKINGVDPGVIASLVRTTTAGSDGKFELDLLPGAYRVSAVPPNSLDSVNGGPGLAQANANWLVGDTPAVQAGKVIELSNALAINGAVFDAAGVTPLAGALVQAIPSPSSVTTDVLHTALGEMVYTPRASNGSVQQNGSFALSADLGTFDFAVRPQASTNFAWLVIPGLQVGTTSTTSAGIGLGDLVSHLPVSYSGDVTLPSMDSSVLHLTSALIRAYVYMSGGAYTADPTKADSVLQVAETRSGDNGHFEILIPAALNRAPSP